MKMKFLGMVLASLAAGQLFGAGGDCLKHAVALSSSQTAKLVKEYDPDFQEYDPDSGVAWFKVTISRGESCTVWIEGGDAAWLGLDVDTDIDDENAPMATFEGPEWFNGGNIQACYLYADEWSDDDPAKGTYYVCVDGEVGQSTTLRFSRSIVGFTQEGEKDNPRSITFPDSTSFKHESKSFIDGTFWYKSSLKAGRKYVVCTKGENIFALETSSTERIVAEDYTNAYSNAYYLLPTKSSSNTFHVDQLGTSGKFDLYYRAIPAWKITDSRREVEDLTAENDYAASIVAGRINSTTSADGGREHYDPIIDESLCRVKLAKGERWLFETSGARTNLMMVAYDDAGNILGSNTSLDNKSFECRVAVTASKSAYYYVGVCDPALGAKDVPGDDHRITVKAVNAADIAKPDAYDPADDVYTGATALEAYPGVRGGDVTEFGFESDVHALNGGDWYDCHKLSCRKGLTYDLRAVFSGDPSETGLSLACKVFYLDSKKKEVTITTSGDLTPFGASDLTFISPVNGLVYIRVWVAEGTGLDYPAHRFRVMAYDAATESPETSLGWLKVVTKGADGQWCLSDKKAYYPNGAVVNVVSNQTVSFKAVSGFSTPANITTNVLPGLGADVPRTVVTGIYYDSYDKYTKTVKGKKKTVTDNDMSGAVTIAPANKAVLASRTLWNDDPRDIFTFKVTSEAGVYYNFRLLNTTLDDDGNEIAGDQVFTVSNATGTVYGPTTALTKQLFTAGTWYLTVAHAVPEDPQDSCYKLEYSAYKHGSHLFSAAKYTVKESAEYVTLTVKRSANQALSRIRYETFAGTSTNDVENAKPGSEYYPTNGIITWANGDKKDKTVKVRLIPDMINQHETAKSFTVKLTPMDPDDIAEDDTEYPAVITRDEATVVLSEVTKAVPGTVKAISYGAGTPFSNAKKPAMTVDAGSQAVVNIARTGGDDGRVAVKVQTVVVKKSAVAGKDYVAKEEVFTWEDGDSTNVHAFAVSTSSSADLSLTKKFIVRMSVLTTGAYKGYAKAGVYAKDVTVTIQNSENRQALAAYAKLAKKDGMTLTGKGATWYVDPDGNLRSSEAEANATMSFTVTGPGLFAAEVESGCAEGGTPPAVTCTVAKVSAGVDGRVVRIIPSGKQTIVFTKVGPGWMSFKDLGGGKTYEWIPFKTAATPFDPSNKAVVNSNGIDKLVWTLADGLADELGLKTRVAFGTSAKSIKMLLTNVADNAVCTLSADDLSAINFQPLKTYYWALEYSLDADTDNPTWTRSPTTWQFSTAAKNAAKTIAGVGGVDELDTYGNRIDELTATNGVIELVQGVKARIELGPDGVGVRSTKTRILAGSLPPGLKLDGTAGKGIISGVPSKAGRYAVVVQTATGTTKKPIYAESLTLRINVTALGTALGNFRGTLAEDGMAMETGAHRLGLLTFSATSAGKLSATAKIAGKTYSFSGSGYGEVERDDSAVTDKALTVLLTSTTKIKNGTKYTNELQIELKDGATANREALYGIGATAVLRLNVLNSKSTAVTEGVIYSCDLCRDNASVAEHKEDIAPFVGYYTVALNVPEVTPGCGYPSGNGYLTLTVAASGKVSLAGMLADGTKVSGSTVGTFDGENALVVPVYFGSGSYCFGGVVKLILGANDADGYPTTVVDASDVTLTWNKDGAKSSEDGEGFQFDISPAGGWYNTLVNLQRYYLDEDFMLDGIPVYLYGNSVKFAKTTGETVSKISYSIKRTTGIASGKLTYRKKSVNHYGILTFNRDANTLLDPEVWTAGFFVDKANTTWTESLPFDILSTKVDRDWSEADPEVPEPDPE